MPHHAAVFGRMLRSGLCDLTRRSTRPTRGPRDEMPSLLAGLQPLLNLRQQLGFRLLPNQGEIQADMENQDGRKRRLRRNIIWQHRLLHVLRRTRNAAVARLLFFTVLGFFIPSNRLAMIRAKRAAPGVSGQGAAVRCREMRHEKHEDENGPEHADTHLRTGRAVNCHRLMHLSCVKGLSKFPAHA